MTRRYWVVRHDHNDIFLQYRALRPDQAYWTRDELLAERFDSQAQALKVIAERFNGRGRYRP